MAKKVGKKGSLFWKLFAVWLVVLAVAAGLLLNYGIKVMEDYDASQRYPSENAKELANVIAGGDYTMLFSGESLSNSMTIEKEEYERRISEAVRENGGCDVQKGFSADASKNPTFIITAGSKKIATVVYERLEEKSEYGFDKYGFKSITPFTEGSYAVKLLVPENCDFYLDGQLMPEKFRTGKSETRTAAADDIEKTGDEILNYYYVDGLMKEPTYRIVYRDTGRDADIVWDDTYKAFTTVTYDISAEAPSNYKVYMNDTEISADPRFVQKNDTPVEALSGLEDYTDEPVTIVTYHVSGLRYKGGESFRFVDFNGDQIIARYSPDDELYYAEAGITPKDLSVYGVNEDYFITRAIAYAKFVNNDKSYWEEFRSYLQPGTPMAKEMDSFWVTFTPHNEYWIENQTLDSVIMYNNDLIFAKVSFDYWIKGYNHQTDNVAKYPTTVNFRYANIGGRWMIVDYSLGEG